MADVLWFGNPCCDRHFILLCSMLRVFHDFATQKFFRNFLRIFIQVLMEEGGQALAACGQTGFVKAKTERPAAIGCGVSEFLVFEAERR